MKIMIYTKKRTIDKCALITIPSTGKEGHTKKKWKIRWSDCLSQVKKTSKSLGALKIEKSPMASR